MPESLLKLRPSHLVYLLRVRNSNKDLNYVITSTVMPNIAVRNIFLLPPCDYRESSISVNIENLNSLTVAEPEQLSMHRSLTFKDLCSVIVKSVSDIFSVEIICVADKDVRDDFRLVDFRSLDSNKSAHVLYSGCVKAYELLSFLTNPQENSFFGMRMFR